MAKRAMNTRSSHLTGSDRTELAGRRARVRALRGKYAFIATSSEDFARRKQKEIQEEMEKR